jgi:cation transport ATPase
LPDAREHKYARVLSATDDEGHSQTDNIIKQIIQTTNQEEEESQSDNGSDQESKQKTQVQVHLILILISIFNCCLFFFFKKKNAMRTWAYAKSLWQLLFFLLRFELYFED